VGFCLVVLYCVLNAVNFSLQCDIDMCMFMELLFVIVCVCWVTGRASHLYKPVLLTTKVLDMLVLYCNIFRLMCVWFCCVRF